MFLRMLVQLYFFPSSETTGTVHRLAGASWNVDLQKKNSQTQFNFSGIDLPTPVLSSMWSGVLLSLLCTSSLVLGLLLPPWCSSSTPSRTVSGPHLGPLGPHHPLPDTTSFPIQYLLFLLHRTRLCYNLAMLPICGDNISILILANQGPI